jgi:hypothetical protein
VAQALPGAEQEKLANTLLAGRKDRDRPATTGEELQARPPTVECLTAQAMRLSRYEQLRLTRGMVAITGWKPPKWSRPMTVIELAKLFGVSRNEMSSYLHDGDVTARKMGGLWSVLVEHIPDTTY